MQTKHGVMMNMSWPQWSSLNRNPLVPHGKFAKFSYNIAIKDYWWSLRQTVW